jgi:hypothetical protein
MMMRLCSAEHLSDKNGSSVKRGDEDFYLRDAHSIKPFL